MKSDRPDEVPRMRGSTSRCAGSPPTAGRRVLRAGMIGLAIVAGLVGSSRPAHVGRLAHRASAQFAESRLPPRSGDDPGPPRAGECWRRRNLGPTSTAAKKSLRATLSRTLFPIGWRSFSWMSRQL